MARTILIDGNVLDEINGGNQQAADKPKEMIKTGDTLYISRQAYKEWWRMRCRVKGPQCAS